MLSILRGGLISVTGGKWITDMPPEFVREVAGRYVELFETVTGRALEADLSPDPEARIREVLGV